MNPETLYSCLLAARKLQAGQSRRQTPVEPPCSGPALASDDDFKNIEWMNKVVTLFADVPVFLAG